MRSQAKAKQRYLLVWCPASFSWSNFELWLSTSYQTLAYMYMQQHYVEKKTSFYIQEKWENSIHIVTTLSNIYLFNFALRNQMTVYKLSSHFLDIKASLRRCQIFNMENDKRQAARIFVMWQWFSSEIAPMHIRTTVWKQFFYKPLPVFPIVISSQF